MGVERNAPCPCGSGKKYKKCCGSISVALSWRERASAVTFDHEKKESIFETFFSVSDFFKREQLAGGCHLISSVLYVLFAEQNIPAVLRIGEVQRPDGKFFDHSWIEIDGQIFDVAIQLTLDEQKNAPAFAGINLGTGDQSKFHYGAHSPTGMDLTAIRIINTSFGSYMDGLPGFKNGAWDLIKTIGVQLGLDISIQNVRQRYQNVKRVVGI